MHARSNAARAATMSSTPVPVPDRGAPDDDEGSPLTLLADLQDDCPGATIVPAGSLSKRRKSGAGYESATDNNVHFDSFRVKSGPDVLRVVDSLLALHVIAPLVISCWRGLWELFGLFPDVYPPWAQAVFGSVLHTLLALTRDVFMRTFDCRRYPEPGRSLIKVLTRCYTWVFATACISHWRGTWFLLDMLGVDATKVVLIWALAALLMLGTRSLRNTMAPPLVVGSDGPDFCFTFTHMFRSDSSRQTWLYVLDCLFSVLVVHTLVVFVWRGAWCIFDIFLYPKRYDWSAWGSLTIGYCITIVAFSLQPCMMSVVQRMSGFSRVLVVDIYHLFSFFGTVNVWRGVWNLLNFYFLPDNPVASNWISHVLPFLLLVLLNSANSILVRGVYIDAEEEGGQCVEFPIYYLRLFFQNRRRKKLMRQHAKRPSGGSGHKSSTLLDNNHHHGGHGGHGQSPSPPSSRKSSKEQPLQPCLSHGLSHGMSHPHHHNLRVQLPPPLACKDIPESPV